MSRIPLKAKAEINSILAENMEISAAELVSILDRYEVREDPAVLQRRYQQTVGQRYMASFLDAEGNRAVLAVRDNNGMTKYTVVDACNDLRSLQSLRHSLKAHASGTRKTEKRVQHRIHALERLLDLFRKAG